MVETIVRIVKRGRVERGRKREGERKGDRGRREGG